MKILLATRNKNKAREVARILSEYRDTLGEIELLTLDDVGIKDDVEENGSTFEENAMIKAKAGAAEQRFAPRETEGRAERETDGALRRRHRLRASRR